MEQMIRMCITKMCSCVAVVSVIVGMGMLASCSSNDNPSSGGTTSEKADLVVYGKVFTSEGNQIVEAFAVKDGKYVYVGDKAGAAAFVEAGKTEVVDYTGKGLVMSGCGNGHAHYMLGYALKTVGTMIGLDVTWKLDETYASASETGQLPRRRLHVLLQQHQRQCGEAHRCL